MEWPAEIVTAFLQGIDDVVLAPGIPTREAAIARFLDEATALAVERCDGDPGRLLAAFREPYTPIGQLSAQDLAWTVDRWTMKGEEWFRALDLLWAYVAANSRHICEVFEWVL